MVSSCSLRSVAIFTATLLLLLFANAGTAHGMNFSYSFLQPHNAARHAVGLAPLVWDEEVAAYALWYATLRSYDCKLIHSHGPYGENLFWGSGVGWDPTDVVAAWVVEKPRYDYETNKCRGGVCGHYTQIVWWNTTALGCALITCVENRGTFGICSYDPPGNYVGTRPY